MPTVATTMYDFVVDWCAIVIRRFRYYCKNGRKTECGSPAVYCGIKETAPVTVTAGYYSTGSGNSTARLEEMTRTGESQCSPGYAVTYPIPS